MPNLIMINSLFIRFIRSIIGFGLVNYFDFHARPRREVRGARGSGHGDYSGTTQVGVGRRRVEEISRVDVLMVVFERVRPRVFAVLSHAHDSRD